MVLQSQLFRGDTKLEAAATSDSAHLVPGAAGEHVRKIQLALIRLGATVPTNGVYGLDTAAAVLEYKQKRDIINRSYQTTADNIVGKMTMAALDKEMLQVEFTPLVLLPQHPISRLAYSRPATHGLLGFELAGFSLLSATDLRPVPVRPPTAPGPAVTSQVEVIIAQGSIGTIRVVGGNGGTLVRSQLIHFYGRSKNGRQVAKLRGAKKQAKDLEELDILGNDVTVTFDALNCGETFFQARVSLEAEHQQKLSDIMRLLSLVDKTTTLAPPPGDYSPEPRIKSGLVSKQGTPLKPIPGRKINIFGEGESAGFEDYSSDIDFCTHNFSNGNGPTGATAGHRPWTADPRKPPGIEPKSVNNICCRGSPIFDVTIREILRIGASKARVTYAEANGHAQSDILRKGLSSAKVIDEGEWSSNPPGHAIVFELP